VPAAAARCGTSLQPRLTTMPRMMIEGPCRSACAVSFSTVPVTTRWFGLVPSSMMAADRWVVAVRHKLANADICNDKQDRLDRIRNPSQ